MRCIVSTIMKPISRKIAGRLYTVDVPFIDDGDEDGPRCSAEDARAAEVAIAAAVAEGPPSAAGLIFIRKALGFTAARIAELLAVRPETISRWENEAGAFDRATWLAIGDLALERARRPSSALARMERLAGGSEPPKQVHVEIEASLR